MDYINIKKHLITYNQDVKYPMYTKAKGARFVDEKGKEYINLNDISSVLGFNHPKFNEALTSIVQTKMLGHMNMMSKDKEILIRNFMDATHHDFDKIFFAGSGGEVVDWSIKVARRATQKDGIISFKNALHGRSFAGAYMSGIELRKQGFGTGLEHVYFWDYPEDDRTFETNNNYSDIAAIIIEPYQALGGMVSPSKEYWMWLRKYTKENNIILIFDEIQTGFGKTGSFFVYETLGIVPDILLAGKGMSNGFGLGAMLMTKEVASSIKPNEMSGGSADNDFMCAVVNSVFSIYKEEQILEHVQEMGNYLDTLIHSILTEYNINFKIHGKGLFKSIELTDYLANKIVSEGKQKGVLLGRTQNKVMVRSPLVVTKDDIKEACEIIRSIVAESI